jgi:hypothetical protein
MIGVLMVLLGALIWCAVFVTAFAGFVWFVPKKKWNPVLMISRASVSAFLGTVLIVAGKVLMTKFR